MHWQWCNCFLKYLETGVRLWAGSVLYLQGSFSVLLTVFVQWGSLKLMLTTDYKVQLFCWRSESCSDFESPLNSLRSPLRLESKRAFSEGKHRDRNLYQLRYRQGNTMPLKQKQTFSWSVKNLNSYFLLFVDIEEVARSIMFLPRMIILSWDVASDVLSIHLEKVLVICFSLFFGQW